jgi:hypothetical protein
MSRANGYFEAFINANAYRVGAGDKALMRAVTEASRAVVPGCQLRWAGSQRKGTAIAGSDLDLCLESGIPVTEGQRRELRAQLRGALGRPAQVLSHVVRLPATAGEVKVDIAFANAAFGSRPLPDTTPFHDQRARQAAARALKLWTRSESLPYLRGWVVEALVVHLFSRIIAWFDERATPTAIEGVLRPAAFPSWNPEWSARLPGRLEALRNNARALRRRAPSPESWSSMEDAGRWLCG